MSGGADGNLSDSSSAVSGLSLRDRNNQGQLVNHNFNLSTSSTSCDAHDPRTLEILRLRAEQQTLRAENCALKRRIEQEQINIYFAHVTFQGIVYICQELFTLQKSQQGAKYPNKQLRK